MEVTAPRREELPCSTESVSQSLQSSSAAALAFVAAAAISLAPAVVHAQGAPPPPATDAPPQGYAPPPQGYAPPPQGYAPPPQGYAPPPQGYAPPPQGYAPPPQGYAPAPQGAYPPGYVPPPSSYYAPPAARGPVTITDWDDSQPVPQGYRVSSKVRTPLIVGGAVTFGVLYGITLTEGVIAGSLGGSALGVIPIVGPFAVIPGVGSGPGSVAADFFLVLDGLGQAAGVALFAAGFAAPRKILVRNDIYVSGVTLMPRPMSFGRNGAGVGLAGAF